MSVQLRSPTSATGGTVAEGAWDAPAQRTRHPGDLARLILAAAVVLAITVLGLLAGTRLFGPTAATVRAVEPRSNIGHVVVGGVQALVVAAGVGLTAGVLWRRRFRVLATTAVTGLVAALVFAGLRAVLEGGASATSAAVDSRGLLGSAHFPSGPWVAAAVAAAVVVEPWLRRPWRRASLTVVVVVGVGRVLVGALLPIELLLAAGVGVAVAAGALLAVGAPDRRLGTAEVLEALVLGGVGARHVVAAPTPAKGATAFVVERADGGPLFVKVLGRDERDADLLYRAYRFLRLRSVDDVRPAASLRQAVEHQALVGLVAEGAGVRVPHVERVIATEDGSAMVAMAYVAGQSLAAAEVDAVDDRVLRELWREVGRLHAAGIAHRSLHTGNVVLDGERRPWIVDFSFSELSAGARHLEIDRAELLASLAALVGPQRAVEAATAELGGPAVSAAVRYLQPLALSAATRAQTAGQDDLLGRTRAAVATATGEPVVELERLQRVRVQSLLMIAVLAGAFYLLLPQVAHVGSAWKAFRSAKVSWIGLVVLLSMLTYLGAAVAAMGSIPQRVRLWPSVLVQTAASFVNRVTPASIGGMVLNGRFLEKSGADRATAVAAVGVNSLAGGVVHLVLIIAFFAWSKSELGKAFKLPSSSLLLISVPVLLAIVGAVLWTKWGRRKLLRPLVDGVRSAMVSLRTLAQKPSKLAMLFGGSTAVTFAYIFAFWFSVRAVGGHIDLAEAGAVFLGASALAAPSPTPGNLGALEAALVAALTGVGVPAGIAVSGVLTYRLATYWLPVLPGWLCWHLIQRWEYV